jgi:SPP1 family phage portal protein
MESKKERGKRMSLFYKYAEMLDQLGGVPTPEIMKEIIADHSELKRRTMDRYGRYQQKKENTPILKREFEGAAAKKINNKLANDYFGEIVDTKTGYVFGVPVVYGYDKSAPNYETAAKEIERFKKVNNLDLLNGEWCKFAAMGGYDAGLCYIDKEGQERVMRIDPWEAVIISKSSFTEPEYGVVYYDTWDDKKRAEFYNGQDKYIFEGADFENLELIVEANPHMFQYCPLFGMPNNAELQGDADKVLTLIDGLDRAFSDMLDEVEQFRLAYLIFVGYEPDEEQIEAMVKTGALWIPDASNGEKIDWLVKNLDPKYIESFLERAEANITRFAKHVNFTDAAFGADITGPAMRYKLFALETKSKFFERQHEAAMLYMFKVIGSAWQTKGMAFDFTMIDCKYTRNIPVNIVDEANAATTLSGITSRRTALGTLSVVKDVDEELELIRQEAEESINLENIDNPNNGGQ